MMMHYEQIETRVEVLLAELQDLDARQIHAAAFHAQPVTMQRLGTVLSRMAREGRIVPNYKRGLPSYRLASQVERDAEPYSQAMRDQMEINKFRPLVSIPKVAPLREIPAWSRQPL